MPVYDYRCPECGNAFEALKKIAEMDRHTCDKCGAEALNVITKAPHLSYRTGVDPDFATFSDKWDRIQRQKGRGKMSDSENERYGANTDEGVKTLRDMDQARGTK